MTIAASVVKSKNVFSEMSWREKYFHIREQCPPRWQTPGTVINDIQAASQCDSKPDLNARYGISHDVGDEQCGRTRRALRVTS